MHEHAGNIPRDVLLEIFHQSLPRPLDAQGRLAFQTLRSVCSSWRSISLSTPALWSSVTVTRRHNWHGKNISLLEAWFLRAGPSIPLELEYNDPSGLIMRDKVKAAMKALLWRYKSRWMVLSLSIDSECFWEALFDVPPSDWTQLHTLTLWTCDIQRVDQQARVEGLERLKKITTIRRILVRDHDGYPYRGQFGPSELGELHITLQGLWDTQTRLISTYTHLTKLALSSPHGFRCRSSLSRHEHVTLPSLFSFSFDAYNLSFLHHFTMPALVSLDVRLTPGAADQKDASFLSAFLSRCTDALESINLDTQSQETFVAEILPQLGSRRNLAQLSFDIWPSKRVIAQDLEEAWFPHLRVLSVTIGSSDRTPRPVFFELERMKELGEWLSRWKKAGRAPLERLTVHKRSEDIHFPYEQFEDAPLAHLCVMVPW
jgi:F-box-like